MSAHADDSIRRLIPRWRFTEQSYSAEFASDPRLKSNTNLNRLHLESKLADWQESKTIRSAIDLVSCGVGGGWIHEVRTAAKFLANHKDNLTHQASVLARQVLVPVSKNVISNPNVDLNDDIDAIVFNHARLKISSARQRLHRNPRNMLSWLDISRGYAILGQIDKAISAVETALILSPHHRHALRVAARLFVHAGDSERAHGLLVRNSRTPRDPWLIAAEISIANIADRGPRFVRAGKLLVESGGLPPEHLTELLSALGTVDLFNGANRRARINLRASLEMPTENSVAQAQWISTQMSGIHINESAFNLPLSFEARCWQAIEQGDWDRASSDCLGWLLDEPYSSRPARIGSYIGICLTNNLRNAEMSVRAGLQADSSDTTLRNNLVVIMAYQGKLSEAIGEFRRIKMPFNSDFPKHVYLATAGLLLFRAGDIDEGRKLYDRAERMAPAKSKIRVSVFRAREELYAGSDIAGEYVDNVKKRNEKAKVRSVKRMLEILDNQKAPLEPTASEQPTDEQLSSILVSTKNKLLDK